MTTFRSDPIRDIAVVFELDQDPVLATVHRADCPTARDAVTRGAQVLTMIGCMKPVQLDGYVHHCCMFNPGRAGRGMARSGLAWQGGMRRGMAWFGKARQGQVRRGKVWRSVVRQGEARHGPARSGLVLRGRARQGLARRARARRGLAL